MNADLMQLKMRIMNSFNNAAETYDQHASLQYEVGVNLIDEISKLQKHYPLILDFGCGTGRVTQALFESLNGDELHAVDVAENLLEQTKKCLLENKVHVYKADFDDIELRKNKFDLIFSNMSLHWSLSLLDTLKQLIPYLNTDGILAMTLPLVGTFNELPATSIHTFYSMDELSELFQTAGYDLIQSNETEIKLHYESMHAAIKAIKAMGANQLMAVKDRKIPSVSHFRKIISRSEDVEDNAKLTYHIGYFYLKKRCVSP